MDNVTVEIDVARCLMDSIGSIGRMPENCHASRTCGKSAVEQPSNTASSAKSTSITASQSQGADITLVTAEGDTVTLSASRTTEVSFETYSSKGQGAESAKGATAEVRKSSEFSLTIDGDLNTEELKDIRKAIKTLFKAERDILKGHDERATERTAKLADLDQIASIDAKMEFRQTVSVAQTTVEAPASAAQPSASPSETETPAVTPPETQQLPETTPAPPVPSPVQQFTVATADKQQLFTFQYLWDGGRPLAVRSSAVPTVNESQPAA